MTTIWKDLYWQTWTGILPDYAYTHPAKFAPGLIRRIYFHLAKTTDMPQKAIILDPFAGTPEMV